MKKTLSAIAMALLLVGCTQASYDDTQLWSKIAGLEQRVTALESSIASIQSTLGSGKFVQKVQELTDDNGKVVGLTVTYNTGEVVNFTISKITDPDAAPVLSVMLNGAGVLCWAIDGVILKDNNGQDIPVQKTPVFTKTEDGHLHVTVDGEDIDLGNVKGDKGDKGDQGEKGEKGDDGTTPVIQDGIIKDLQVTDEAVIIVYGDDSQSVSIPLVSSFRLNIEKTEFVLTSKDPIEVPYTITNATAETVVDVFCGSELRYRVEADKVVFTPKSTDVEAQALVYADSKTGLTSIVKLVFEGETFEVEDTPYSGEVDYLVEDADAAVEVNVVSNIPFEVKPQVEWIKYVETKAQHYTVCLTVDDNTVAEPRTGSVNIVRKGTEEVLQTIVIGQKPMDSAINLSKKGSANCYIVPAAGSYKFAAVKGNSNESVGNIASAEIVWETWNNREDITANSVIASVEADGSFIRFATPEAYHTGNALIAAKDANGIILWSWHIWATDKTIQGTDCGYEGEALVMNYNLGAIDELGTTGSFGLQYQWGRKDPFIGGGDLGHSDPAKIIGTAMTKTTDRLSEETATQNPTLFYIVGDNGKDWFAGDAFDRWAVEKTVNDPCPVGWRAAHFTDNTIFMASSVTFDADNYIFTIDGKASFPVSGTLNYESGSMDKNDSIYHFGDNYNTTTPDGWRMRCDKGTGSKTPVRKASGGAVRCVAVAE